MQQAARQTVVVGFLGTTLDLGGKRRWERWRPTVDLCRHDDLVVARLELLVPPGAQARALAAEVVEDIALVSPETRVCLHPFEVADPWDFASVYEGLAAFADGLGLDDDGVDLLVHVTTGTHVAQICLFLLTESRRLPGRLLQTQPPPRVGPREPMADALPGRLHVIDLDLARYDALAKRARREHDDGVAVLKSGIPTKNAGWNALMGELWTVARRSPAPVLLDGPTGAGKTQLARRVYELKKLHRQLTGPFVEVNCATIAGDTAMSTLFGHKRGAFTGADKERSGLLVAAHGGLLFLDEVGELGLDEQAMLLRAIEDKRFRPMGSDVEVGSDFQLIAGTNRDLQGLVQQGRFRDDLLARLAVWRFTLPALRERREDIAPNLDVELERVSARLGHVVRCSTEARARFLAFATGPEGLWPGNFRELAASVERMATLAEQGRIDVAVVDRECARLRQGWQGQREGIDVDGGPDLVVAALGAAGAAGLDRFERVQLQDVLRVCAASPSLSAAGRVLFAQSRAKKSSTNDADRLRKYLVGHGLTFAGLPRLQALR